MAKPGTPPSVRQERYERLVDEYFATNFDKTEATRRCGYSCPNNNAYKLFQRPAVKALIAKRKAQMRKKYELDEEWIIQRLMRIADASLGAIVIKLVENEYDLTCLDEDEQYAIAEFKQEAYKMGRGPGARDVLKTTVKVQDQKVALIALCRKLGLFNDKLEVGGEVSLIDRIQAGRDRMAKEREALGEDEKDNGED